MQPYEQFINAATSARRLAADYLRDAMKNNVTTIQRERMICEAKKCSERADWYALQASKFGDTVQ